MLIISIECPSVLLAYMVSMIPYLHLMHLLNTFTSKKIYIYIYIHIRLLVP